MVCCVKRLGEFTHAFRERVKVSPYFLKKGKTYRVHYKEHIDMNYVELDEQIKQAMRNKDANRRDILRMVKTELKNIEVNERREITEQDVNDMLKRTIKQTKDTLEGSIKADNDALRTEKLTEQVAILESYLPEQLSGDALAQLVDEMIAETGASSKKDMGSVMKALTARTGGNFDKAAAAQMVGAKLA